MIRKSAFFTSLSFLSLCFFVQGCVTKDVKPKNGPTARKVIYDVEQGKPLSIAQIKEKIDEDPDNPQGYFLLGEAYEKTNQLLAARDSYVEGMTRFKNGSDYREGQQYTGGHYRLGRVYARLGGYQQAIWHLEEIVGMLPKKSDPAYLRTLGSNPDFRESHYLLGACYRELNDLNKAKFHFEEFVRLGGRQERAAIQLVAIERELEGRDKE